jgi:hypothetical protein
LRRLRPSRRERRAGASGAASHARLSTISRDYTVAPDGRPFIVEPSERRPGVTHLCVVTNWYQLLK